MDQFISVVSSIPTGLYYISLPIVKPIQWILIALSPFWYLVQFLLLPVTHLLHVVFGIISFPFRLQLLDKLETIYIYLGIAALIGLIAGSFLHVCFSFLSSALNIDTMTATQRNGRTVASYKAERRKKKALSLDHAPSPLAVKREDALRNQRGLLSQTIIEEDDSDF